MESFFLHAEHYITQSNMTPSLQRNPLSKQQNCDGDGGHQKPKVQCVVSAKKKRISKWQMADDRYPSRENDREVEEGKELQDT
jgi:hypothetical protein